VTDVHAAIVAALELEEAVARHTAEHWRADEWREAIDDVPLFALEHIAMQDPARTQRRIAAERDVLARHPLLHCGNPGCKGYCPRCHDGDDCPGECPEVLSLMQRCGIEVPDGG
jgi:hypothetical protein